MSKLDFIKDGQVVEFDLFVTYSVQKCNYAIRIFALFTFYFVIMYFLQCFDAVGWGGYKIIKSSFKLLDFTRLSDSGLGLGLGLHFINLTYQLI